MKKRPEYADLAQSLKAVRYARGCISGQREGFDRSLAEEGYESAVAEMEPILHRAVELATGDLPPREVERLAEWLIARLVKALES